MFKKTLLTLAIAGVSIASNAATVKTTATATTAVLQQAAIGTAGKAGTALGTDNAFNGGVNDNCLALAAYYGTTLTKIDGTAAHATAAAGLATDTALFLAGSGLSSTKVYSTAANACTAFVNETFSTTAAKDGLEYTQATELELKPIVIAGIGGYKAEDTLTFDFAGGKIDLTKTVAPVITVDFGVAGDADSTADVTGGINQAAAGGVTFDILDISANQVRFTVKSTTPASDYVRGGAVLKLSKIFLDSTGLAASTSVTLASKGTNTSGTEYDPSAATTFTTLLPQYTTEVTTMLNADIDVGKDRQQFALGTVDALTLTSTLNPATNLLVPSETTTVITGDFSWAYAPSIDANKDGKLSSAELIAGKVIVHSIGDDAIKSLALNATNTELTVVSTVTGAKDLVNTFTFNVPGFDAGKGDNPEIAVQSFTAKVDTISDKSIGNTAVNMPSTAAVNAGAWQLNGSVVVVPYAPFGPNTQPIIRHTNKGTQTGDLTVRYMVEGVDSAWRNLTAANMANLAPGVHNLLTPVTDALKGEGYDATATGFKVALEFVTNVPSKDVFIYAGAKVTTENSDRIHLLTRDRKSVV